MKYLFTTILILCCVPFFFAQNPQVITLENGEILQRKPGQSVFKNPDYAKKIEAVNYEDQFLSPEFQDALFYWQGNEYRSTARYNIFKDYIEVKIDDTVYDVNFDFGAEVRIGPYNFQKSPLNNLGIVDVLFEENDVMLVRKFIVTFTPGREARDSYVKARPGEFSRDGDVYFLIAENEVHELKSKNKLLKTLEMKSAEKFVKENDLNFDEEEDLLQLAQFIAKQ